MMAPRAGEYFSALWIKLINTRCKRRPSPMIHTASEGTCTLKRTSCASASERNSRNTSCISRLGDTGDVLNGSPE